MVKSKDKLAMIFLLILICSFFYLTGCKDVEQEKAVADAAAAKTELATIKTKLADIIGERDGLKEKLTAAIEVSDKLKTIADQATVAKEKLAGLTKERDAAIAKATNAQDAMKKLQNQLTEQVEKVTGLETKNKNLQTTIDELKKKFGGKVAVPTIPEF